MSDLRLVIFDVDGTLVDSQGDIVGSMTRAFDVVGLAVPDRSEILSVVGLSLEVIMPRLAPDASAQDHALMVETYKTAYQELRAAKGSILSSPLYPGARDVLDTLRAEPETLLGVATGKSRRGLDTLLDGHELRGYFVTEQVSDYHPSKPHPAMLSEALSETGMDADRAVMVGDTSFDIDMAKAAGLKAIGVSWGYHARDKLAEADVVIDRFEELLPVLNEMLG